MPSNHTSNNIYLVQPTQYNVPPNQATKNHLANINGFMFLISTILIALILLVGSYRYRIGLRDRFVRSDDSTLWSLLHATVLPHYGVMLSYTLNARDVFRIIHDTNTARLILKILHLMTTPMLETT